MTIEIRQAMPQDAGLLHDVAAATFPLACPPHTTRAAIRDFIADHLSETSFDGYLADPQRALFLAVEGEVAIGYTMVVFGDPTDADAAASITIHPTAELSKVYVREGHHGAGVAGRLVESSIASAAEHGAAGIWLGVNQENARANRFYEKQGFALVGTKRFLVGGQYEDDFVRERSI
ncbi:MAG: family N-acetyltransferase [Glaciihabitans sp.]|nr:family N-acetyltransferase [Glaciihabitans sp.]